MAYESPQFSHGIAGARPAHPWPGPRPPDLESPTGAARLIIVCTPEPEPDQARSGQQEGLLRRLRSLSGVRRGGSPRAR
jgi:hypothetical protein